MNLTPLFYKLQTVGTKRLKDKAQSTLKQCNITYILSPILFSKDRQEWIVYESNLLNLTVSCFLTISHKKKKTINRTKPPSFAHL